MKSILFDSHAILKFYQDEENADKVEALIVSAGRGELGAYVSELNLGEIYCMTIRRLGKTAASDYLEQFRELPIEVVPVTTEVIMAASEIKAEFPISYADCFAAATALFCGNATIITGDPEFAKIEHIVKVEWV